jgi:hypothetical protein
MTPDSKPILINPQDFQEVMRDQKFSNAPGPNVIPNRALKHLKHQAVFLLVQIFNAIFLTQIPYSMEVRSFDFYT